MDICSIISFISAFEISLSSLLPLAFVSLLHSQRQKKKKCHKTTTAIILFCIDANGKCDVSVVMQPPFSSTLAPPIMILLLFQIRIQFLDFLVYKRLEVREYKLKLIVFSLLFFYFINILFVFFIAILYLSLFVVV